MKNKKIIFIGTPNAYPMGYALEMKDLGYDVTYLVDVEKGDTLSRPECQFSEIKYPYPDWILERVVKKTHWRGFLPSLLFRDIINICKKYDVIVLSGHYVSITKYLKDKHIIGLFAGADLYFQSNPKRAMDWANQSNSNVFMKYLKFIFARQCMTNNYNGLSKLNTLVYFPIGLNPDVAEIINYVEFNGVNYIPRYDVNPRILNIDSDYEFEEKGNKKLVIISPVRFCFSNSPGGDINLNKGNDTIITGLSLFKKINSNFEVHFFEKGPDTQLAKSMCSELGLTENVVWHKQMPLPQLIELYHKADVCFDQVGTHWVSAVGCYALFLGVPLVANSRQEIMKDVWGEVTPICDAKTAEEICSWLVKLQDPIIRKKISSSSVEFANNNLSMKNVANKIINDIKEGLNE